MTTKPQEENAYTYRKGNKLYAVVEKGELRVKERIPLQVERWEEEKQARFYVGVAMRLKRRLANLEQYHASQL